MTIRITQCPLCVGTGRETATPGQVRCAKIPEGACLYYLPESENYGRVMNFTKLSEEEQLRWWA
jgi:hypothetical protein